MQVPTSAQVTPPTVTVNNGVTVARGFSTEVRSDVPPVQQGEGVRYTRGRPSDNDTYNGLYAPRKRNALAENADPSQSIQDKDAVGAYGENPAPAKKSADSDEQVAAENDGDPLTLSAEDQALVEQLQKRDREVRLHELAHQTAGGQFTGSASYEYKRGPDGKNYAVEGEVSVDVSAADNPEDTIQKARQVKAAALAPAQPSSQDRQVAREAEQLIADAQQALRVQAQAEAKAQKDQQDQTDDEGDNAIKNSEQRSAADNAPSGAPLPSASVQSTVPAAAPAVVPVAAPEQKVAASAGDDKAAKTDQKDSEDSPDARPKATAREALEKILLAGQPLTVQAGNAGYARPDAPAGDSGLLDIVI